MHKSGRRAWSGAFWRSPALGAALALSGCFGGHCDDHPLLGPALFCGMVLLAVVGLAIIRND